MQVDGAPERSGRSGFVTSVLTAALPGIALPDSSARVLDCGGGSGAMAVPLAVAGASVTVVDISADALATLHRRADEAGVADRVRSVQADLEQFGGVVPSASFDLVLAHGILDAVEQVGATFAACADAARPGGLLSVLVHNPAAAVLARALAGEPLAALAELRHLDGAVARIGPDVVRELCADAGFAIDAVHGVGVFSDLVPGAALDTAEARDAVRALDTEAAGRSPFAEIAGRVHVLARRPDRPT